MQISFYLIFGFIVMRVVKITYKIERRDKFFLVYTNDSTYLQCLGIPFMVTDDLCSVSVTVENYKTVGEQICSKLKNIFLTHWNFNYGLPQIVFTGDTSKLKDEYKNSPVYIFFILEDKARTEQINLWRNQLRFNSKFTFVNIDENGNSFVTKDHNLVDAWLDQYSREDDFENLYTSRYDFKKIMHDWYLEDHLDKKLMEAADEAIAMFVYARSYSSNIPAYLVVPLYHYKRYGHAVKILMNSFDTKFVMSLPIDVDKKQYSVLFPIIYEN